LLPTALLLPAAADASRPIGPALSRLVTTTDALNRASVSQYAAAGLHRFLVNRRGETCEMVIDPNGNLLAVTEGTAVLTRTYEADRDLVSTCTNAEGETIAHERWLARWGQSRGAEISRLVVDRPNTEHRTGVSCLSAFAGKERRSPRKQ